MCVLSSKRLDDRVWHDMTPGVFRFCRPPSCLTQFYSEKTQSTKKKGEKKTWLPRTRGKGRKCWQFKKNQTGWGERKQRQLRVFVSKALRLASLAPYLVFHSPPHQDTRDVSPPPANCRHLSFKTSRAKVLNLVAKPKVSSVHCHHIPAYRFSAKENKKNNPRAFSRFCKKNVLSILLEKCICLFCIYIPERCQSCLKKPSFIYFINYYGTFNNSSNALTIRRPEYFSIFISAKWQHWWHQARGGHQCHNILIFNILECPGWLLYRWNQRRFVFRRWF